MNGLVLRRGKAVASHRAAEPRLRIYRQVAGEL